MGLDAVLIGADYAEANFDGEVEDAAWLSNVLDHVAQRLPEIRDLELGRSDGEPLGERIGSYSALHQLREYAAHLEVFSKPPARYEGTDAGLLREIYGGSRATGLFPHLINFSDCEGLYLPIALAEPIWIELEEGTTYSVGSSIALARELRTINEFLGVRKDHGQLRDEGLDPYEVLDLDDGTPRWQWGVLHWLARVSVERNLLLQFC
jgi:hypothetical protein